MNNELDFLLYNNMSNNDNKAGIFNTNFPNHNSGGNYAVVYKNPSVYGSEAIKNSLKTRVYNNDSDKNPYIKLIEDFSKKYYRSVKFKPSHFFYLKELGVQPLNKMIVLRRFAEGVIVPHNLMKMKPSLEPISTIVTWSDTDEKEFFKFSFNEKWTVETRMVHEIIKEVLSNEFGIKGEMFSAIPGFSQGLLFGFLKKMGATEDFDTNLIPQGNPNVLQEGATRETEKFGLESDFTYNMKVVFEQKFQSTNGVDSTMAFLDIINNLLTMGTSNTKYILKSSSPMIQSLITAANSQGKSTSEQFAAWTNFIGEVITGFVDAVGEIFGASADIIKNTAKPSGSSGGNSSSGTGSGGMSFGVKTQQSAAPAAPALPSVENPLNNNPVISNLLKLGEGLIGSILASTVAKYKWQFIGSVGAMTGMNTTPWHLTIGNPYQPTISVGNMIVSKVEVSFSNEIAFNDLPMYITANLTISFGRKMGKQELYSIMNNNYNRIYSKTKPPSDVVKP